MTTDKSNQLLHLTIYGKPIVQVSDFIYLCHKLSATNDGTAAAKHRIGLGWAAFEKNKELLTSKCVPYNIKTKVYNTYVLPVVMHGLECINWTYKLCMTVETSQERERMYFNHVITYIQFTYQIEQIRKEKLLHWSRRPASQPAN